MSDGESSCSDTYINQAIANDIKIYTLGFGTASGDGILQTIANRTGGKFFKAVTGDELEFVSYMLGILNGADLTDSDNDGIPDVFETMGMRTQTGEIIYTDPSDPDCDGDGLLDGAEINSSMCINRDASLEDMLLEYYRKNGISKGYNGFYFKMSSDPTKKDSDEDGLDDSQDTNRLLYNNYNKYNRNNVKEYATKYSETYNPNYMALDRLDFVTYYLQYYSTFTGMADCANFVSQCIYAGGIEMNNNWYYFQNINSPHYVLGIFADDLYVDKDGNIVTKPVSYYFSPEWSVANSQYLYFSNIENGYVQEVITLQGTKDEVKTQLAKLSGKVKAGDLLYWDFENDGTYNHATIITGINDKNELLYSGHTKPRNNYSVIDSYEPENKITIVIMKDLVII